MEKISNNINLLFKKLFFVKNKHPFLDDLERVNEINKKFINYQKKIIKKKIKYDADIEIPESKNIEINKKKQEFNIKVLKSLASELKKSNNYKRILFLVNKLYNQNIPSNVAKINFSEYKKSNRINVAIVGSGPIGLFLACYLEKFYNTSYGLNDQPKINIVVFDNRIVDSGIRKPYLRKRPFAFSSSFFSYILPKVFTWNDNQEKFLLLSIYILEYIMFAKAYYEFEIPFIFNKYSWDEFCSIFKKGDFKIVFDCTGGRLNPPIFKDVNTSWVKKILKSNKDFNFEIIKEKNIVKLKTDTDNFTDNYYYGSLYVQELVNNKYIYKDKIDLDIHNFHDLKLFIKLKDKHFEFNDILLICKNIKSDHQRNYLYNLVTTEFHDKDYIFSFDLFNTYIRHSIEISKVVNYNNHKFLYIASGDTIFHSHFIVGAGMNRTITFAVKCANFITYLSLNEN